MYPMGLERYRDSQIILYWDREMFTEDQLLPSISWIEF